MSPRVVSLHSAEASLVLECRAGAAPLWRHLGARVEVAGLAPLADGRMAASFSLDADVPLATLPPSGRGWFGPKALELRRAGVALVPDFARVEVAATPERIDVALSDDRAGIAVEQSFTLEPGGCFRIGATLRNTGSELVVVDWLASVLVPLAAQSQQLISWRGRHNGELVELGEPMPGQGWAKTGRRGLSGHGGPPALIVPGEGAGRHSGLVYALQLAWSGDSHLAVERDDEGFWVLAAGAVFQPGEVVLAPGESYAAPDALVAVSTHGRNGAMAQQHAAVRARLAWPGGVMTPRKVHLNSWEACYFDHDERRITELAEAAAAIGVERFVLDDGWFKGRGDDCAGLGDWTPDRSKYPAGLGPLAQRVNALGMEFGLWVEPEMVNPDSDLYRAHPDWALALPGDRPTARNQLVLDLRRSEVRDYLFGALDTLLREVPISYLKWDHNRDLAPAGGAAQVRGTYDLLAWLRAAHPSVEIESCAGGGGRSDAGIAAYTHRFWTSDNIDAVSRVPIQRGFLNFLPPEVMGAHVGASPSHATGRSQSLGFRAAVAMPGHFGVELDPRKLSEADRAELAEWIAFYKSWRHLLHGRQTWLGEGADGLVWQAVGNAEEFLLFAIRSASALDRRPQPLPLPFVDGNVRYRTELLRVAGRAPVQPPSFTAAQVWPGSWLAAVGLSLPPLGAESVAIFRVERTK